MKKYNVRIDESESALYNEVVHQHLTLVKRIAHHLLARLPASVLLDDLVQSGLIGLIEAHNNFDPTKGASFETYAGIRIRGSMLDEIRKGDWAPRSVHRNARAIASAMNTIEHRTGMPAQAQDIAKELGVALDEYFDMLKDTSSVHVFSFEDLGFSEELMHTQHSKKQSGAGPLESTAQQKFKAELSEKITDLPQREALILALYYDEDMNLREIGDILGVSESRVSQLHAQAMVRLKSYMQDWGE